MSWERLIILCKDEITGADVVAYAVLSQAVISDPLRYTISPLRILRCNKKSAKICAICGKHEKCPTYIAD